MQVYSLMFNSNSIGADIACTCKHFGCLHTQNAVADLRAGARDVHAPGGPNSFTFMQFSAEKNRLGHPLWELAPPPPGKILDPPLKCAHNVSTNIKLVSQQ